MSPQFSSLTLFLLSAALTLTGGEVFTALVDLEKVLHVEREVAQDLRTYVSMERHRLDTLVKLAEDFERHSALALADPERHLANPVNAFQLVKRFTTDWNQIIASYFNSNSSAEFLASLLSKTKRFPDEEDLSGAAMALLRLQDTYALQTERLVRGELEGATNSPLMTANDCFELGRIAYNGQDYYHTVLWIEEALNLYELELPEPTVDRATLLDYLAYATYMQGNPGEALRLTNEFLLLEPTHTRALNNRDFYTDVLEKQRLAMGDEGLSVEVKNERPSDDYRASHEFATYERLCRGEKTHVYKYEHKLTCRYVHHHPLFYISPLKEEVFYLKPRIVIYHGAITDGEIATVKELATSRLARATVQNSKTGALETANYRVSKSAWLKDIEHPVVARISQRVKAMSNLTLDTVEELQVVNYGIGGHYEPHFDFARKDEVAAFSPDMANRIATVMFYMSDVDAGGATVFPEIGVRLVPKKGSCALWFNLLRNGEGDYDTRHAACPVLTGSKWVSNKWFHERGQEFVRPCSLNPDE